MRRIRNKLTNSSARGLSLCWKRSGNIPVVVTEGDRFFSAPELQTDGVDVLASFSPKIFCRLCSSGQRSPSSVLDFSTL